MSQTDKYTLPTEAEDLSWLLDLEPDADLPSSTPPDPKLFFEEIGSLDWGAAPFLTSTPSVSVIAFPVFCEYTQPLAVLSEFTLSTESSEDPNASEYSSSAFPAPVPLGIATPPFNSEYPHFDPEFNAASNLTFLDLSGQPQAAPTFYPHAHAVEAQDYDDGTCGQPVHVTPPDRPSVAAAFVGGPPPAPPTIVQVPIFSGREDGDLDRGSASTTAAHMGRIRTKPFTCLQCGHR